MSLSLAAGVVVVRAQHVAVSSRPAQRTVPVQLTVPGTPPRLPWPASVHAALDVPGVGRLVGQSSTAAVPIGSVAKVMTAWLVLRAHPLGPHDAGPAITVTPQDSADYRSRIGTGQSLVPLEAGQRLTERQALESLLVPSANDVATLLARWVSGDVPAFVTAMNDAARAVGMTSTHYTDPSGFDAGTVSSADDQVLLAEHALEQPALADVVAQGAVDVPNAGRLRNYNSLLGQLGVDGVKTGSTLAAGGNLVFSASRVVAGRPVRFFGAVLGSGVGAPPLAALDTAIAASRAALTAAQAALAPVTVLPAGARVATLSSGWAAPIPAGTAEAVTVLCWPGTPLRVELTGAALPPGPAGRPAGRLRVTPLVTGAPAVEVPVVTAEALAEPSLDWRVRLELGAR